MTRQLELPFTAQLTDPQRTTIASHVEDGWQHRAACAGQEGDLWFPDDGDTATRERAVKVCRRCPVIESCRAAGMLGDEAGIWGAATQDQRHVLVERIAYGAPAVHVLDRTHRLPNAAGDAWGDAA